MFHDNLHSCLSNRLLSVPTRLVSLILSCSTPNQVCNLGNLGNILETANKLTSSCIYLRHEQLFCDICIQDWVSGPILRVPQRDDINLDMSVGAMWQSSSELWAFRSLYCTCFFWRGKSWPQTTLLWWWVLEIKLLPSSVVPSETSGSGPGLGLSIVDMRKISSFFR